MYTHIERERERERARTELYPIAWEASYKEYKHKLLKWSALVPASR